MKAVRIAKPACLDRLAQHALIEASAGTGKTYTIEHLVVDLVVRQGVPIEQVLVVTFTRKAAAEMADRHTFLDLWPQVRRAAHRADVT